MGTIKDRNGMGLTKTEGIKKVARIHSIQKKIFMTQITTMV